MRLVTPQTRMVLSSSDLAARAPSPQRPIILLAFPRSGSQLLRAVFNADPRVFVAAYSNLLHVLASARVSWSEVAALLRSEYGEAFRTREHLIAFFQKLYFEFWTTSDEPAQLGKRDVERWGFINYRVPIARQTMSLAGLFPDAHFVHVVRDGRGVVASWMANWEVASFRMPVPRRAPAEVARSWVEWVRAARDYGAHTVRLEELADPARRPAAVQALFAHCGLEVRPEVRAFTDELPWVNAERRVPERWRSDLSAEALASLYRVEGFEEVLREHGYL